MRSNSKDNLGSPKSYEVDELDNERSTLIQDNSKDAIADIPMCGFMSVKYYQPYFDVDTADIHTRLLHSTFFCRREQSFMTLISDKPDAYGPFWIATTLVFALAVASHLNGWFSSWMRGHVMEYNFQSVLTASSVVYSFAFGAPLLIWFIFKQFEPKIRFAPVFCLYGYSLVNYIPAVLFCLVPVQSMTWLSLIVATFLSTILLLRNLAPFVVVPENKNAMFLLGLVGVIQFVFMICIKVYFFYNRF